MSAGSSRWATREEIAEHSSLIGSLWDPAAWQPLPPGAWDGVVCPKCFAVVIVTVAPNGQDSRLAHIDAAHLPHF